MSNHESGSIHGAESESSRDNQQKTSETAQHACQAPYEPAEQYPIPGSYIVGFHPGYTVAKHFVFLSREFNLTKMKEGYFAEMDDELFNAVRCDPGVRLVAQNASGERD